MALVLVAFGPSAVAQDPPDYFPLEVGRAWTYHATYSANNESRNITVVSRVARREHVAGVGECAVVEDHSGERLLNTTWYRVADGERVLHPRTQSGRRLSEYCAREGDRVGAAGRVLFDPAAVSRLDTPTSWEWASPDGSARGAVTLEGRDRIRVPNFGSLECLLLVDNATATSGGQTATIERRFWLAPGLGIVQERTSITGGGVTTVYESTLVRHDAP